MSTCGNTLPPNDDRPANKKARVVNLLATTGTDPTTYIRAISRYCMRITESMWNMSELTKL